MPALGLAMMLLRARSAVMISTNSALLPQSHLRQHGLYLVERERIQLVNAGNTYFQYIGDFGQVELFGKI